MNARALAAAVALALTPAAQEPAPTPAPAAPATNPATATSFPSAMFTGRAARREAFRDPAVLAAVRAGLGWLLGHQDEKGFWDCDGFMKQDPPGKECDGAGNPAQDVGVTGLALLALLAQADPVHVDATRPAADWLVSQQHAASGRFHCATHDFVYAQAIATLALIEAGALLGEARYLAAAGNGLRCLESHHNADKAWRYQPKDGDNDTSATSWCVAAYAAAAHAGLAPRADTVAEAIAWLEGVTTLATGHCGYSNRGEVSARMPGDHATRFPVELGEAMTAASLHLRAAAGLPADDPLVRRGLRVLTGRPPAGGKAADSYYWFHGSEAVAAFAERQDAQKWSAALHKAALPLQRKDGSALGSWDPTDVWGETGGRVATTALAVLALSSPWRLGPTAAAATVPDAPPFRAAYGRWKEGKLGAVVAALREVDAAAPTPEQQVVARRARWFATVQLRAADLIVAGIARLHASNVDRIERLEQLAAAYPETPTAEAAATARESVLKLPGVRDDIESDKLLREILASFDNRVPPRDSGKRRALRDRFEKIVRKYPATQAAAKANEWIAFLR